MTSRALLAVAPVRSWELIDWAIFIIVICAVVGIVYTALNYFGVSIPPVLLRIVGIVIVAAFAILAIRFLLSL